MGKGLKALIIIVAVLAVIGLGIFFFIKGPDMKPLSSYLPWGSGPYEVKYGGNYDPPPTISPQVRQAVEQEEVKYEAIIQQKDTREDQILSQLSTAGISVEGAYIVDSAEGEQMLALNVPLTGSLLSSGNFMTSVADSLIKLADMKTLDLKGLAYVNVFVTDDDDRVIFGVTAKTSDIQDYRNRKTTVEQFFATTAASVESRSGAVEAIGGGL